jgi:CHAT domain-containing protein
MKSVAIGFSLLATVLQLAATIGTAQQARSQSIIPISDITPTKYIVEQNILLAEAVPPSKLQTALDQENITEAVPQIEQTWEKQYEGYFGVNFSDRPMTTKYIADTLGKMATQTGKKPALIYLVPQAQQLEIVLITPESQPIHKRIPEAKNEALLAKVRQFRQGITNPNARNPKNYLPEAQQLYQWLVAPIEADLKSNNIDTLVFCMGGGLRTIPLAALHDGKQFLIEKYSLGRIPAFKFTDTLYANMKKSQVLAMGASEFKDQNPLPAVPVELSAIAKDLWRGKSFLNQQFTLNNLQSQRTKQPFKIIHLATHADFKSGSPSNSYVQFWDKKLTLDKMRQLRWNNPPVDLLVLSACRTAIGDKEAELGFAGLAVQSGVKSALASLWYVSDEGTLGLMTEFYRQLQTAPIKAEALRQAQIAMIQGKVRLENGSLHNSRGKVSLPPALAAIKDKNLSHPYYWAAFKLIGSPW